MYLHYDYDAVYIIDLPKFLQSFFFYLPYIKQCNCAVIMLHSNTWL